MKIMLRLPAVEYVNIHSGGQALVGIVEAPGGGVQPNSENQSHGTEIASRNRSGGRAAGKFPSSGEPLARRPHRPHAQEKIARISAVPIECVKEKGITARKLAAER